MRFQDPGGSLVKDALRAVELAAWQEALLTLYPSIASEAVLDVIAVSSGRLLVLTDAHVAMLKVTASRLSLPYHSCCSLNVCLYTGTKSHSRAQPLDRAVMNRCSTVGSL